MMDGKMDDRDIKLKSLMDLIQEMKMEGSHDMPGKPKLVAVDIHAEKMPGKMPMGEMPEGDEEKMEDPAHEQMESPEFEKGEDEGEMEAEQHPEDQGDLMSKLPPAIQQLLKEHLRKKM